MAMDEEILVTLLCFFLMSVVRGCPNAETQLVFEICQTDAEVVNGSSYGYLRVQVQPLLLECNCTLSTQTPDYLSLAVLTQDFFPHSFNVFAGATNKISVNSGFVGNGVGSGFINKTNPWQLNLSRNKNIRRGSQTQRNESICLGYNIKNTDLSIHCKSRFHSTKIVTTAAFRKVIKFVLISLPVLLVLLFVVAVIAVMFHRKGNVRAQYEHTNKKRVSFDKERKQPKLTTPTTKVNPDLCVGHMTDTNVDEFDKSDFPLPPPEAYT